MKKKSSIRLGPGAPSLILIFVVLSMSILAMLSILSARNDLQLSRRSAEATEMVYRLYERAEERRAVIGALLADGGEDALDEALETESGLEGVGRIDDQLVWTETDGVRTLDCALQADSAAEWTALRLTTNIAEDTAMERETAAKLALADALLERQQALDALLERCADGAKDREEYLERVAAALPEEPMAEGGKLEGDTLTWIESDGEYSYLCTVAIHSLDAERRSDFAEIPVLLEETEELEGMD